MSPFDLTGKVAIVTGGNGGIGLGIARGLANAGAAVALAARNEAKTREAVAELEAEGGHAFGVRVDVTDEASVQAMVRTVVGRFGRLDILVNNAGINIRKPPEEFTLEEWHRVLDTDLTSIFLCSRAAYPEFKKAGGGKILNTGSLGALFAAPYAAPYNASKGGMVQLTKCLATAWAKDNIQVNAFHPGYTDTEFMRRARDEVPGMHEKVISRSPMKRWGVPEDFAGLAVFLASSASDFVTGASIFIDGGFSCT
ncbi:MAG TPA: glucose 1-dehydrogenase [Methylomirabilota bacterium]|jgi:2-deoxy-D-gluconate 3-dehydrogenase|nr:glucose 1-dehydrogenase [Methylomirabilota bacterium]